MEKAIPKAMRCQSKWRKLKMGLAFFLMLGTGASLILSGCGTQPEAKEQVETSVSPSSGGTASQTAGGTASLSPESLISASQLDAGIKAKKDWAILDVREPNEFASGHVPTSMNLPLGKLEQNLSRFPKDKETILVCLNGTRSFTAWQILIEKGYDPQQVKVLVGGMEQWKSLGSGEVTDSIGGC